jgi:outer membrane biosynthesis protein TonB
MFGQTDSHRRCCLSSLLALCAAWPLLLPAAEPVQPQAPVQEQELEERIDSSELTRIKTVPAQYPMLGATHGIECRVILHFTLLPDGSPSDIKAVQTEAKDGFGDQAIQAMASSLFEESAIRALQQWRYEPVIRDGRAVAVPAVVAIKFVPNRRVN